MSKDAVNKISILIGVVGIIALYNFSDYIQTRTFWCPAKMSKPLCAGILQARASLFSGIAALIAGWLLYRAATVDARHRREEKAQKKEAYKQRLRITIDVVKDKIKEHCAWVKAASEEPRAHGRFPDMDVTVEEALSGKSWENHAMFSAETIRAIYDLRVILNGYKIDIEIWRGAYVNDIWDSEIGETRYERFLQRVEIVTRQIVLCEKLLSREF